MNSIGFEYDEQVDRSKLPKVDENFEEYSGMYKPSYSGFPPPVCVSALQKAIRRGFMLDAFQWGLELFRTGPHLRSNVWNRLLIIAIEDIGIADPMAIIDVYSLYQLREFKFDPTNSKKMKTEGLLLLKAIYRLVIAKKSRIADHMVYRIGINFKFKGTIETWSQSFYKSLTNKNMDNCIYYATAICRHEENVKIDGKGRATNPQQIIWTQLAKILGDNLYLKILNEICNLDNLKWKGSCKMFHMHLICMICLSLIDTIKLKNLEELKSETVRKLESYYDLHNDRLNLVGAPDYALDKHTAEGKKLKRGFAYFFEVSSIINNEHEDYKKLSEMYREYTIDNLKRACAYT